MLRERQICYFTVKKNIFLLFLQLCPVKGYNQDILQAFRIGIFTYTSPHLLLQLFSTSKEKISYFAAIWNVYIRHAILSFDQIDKFSSFKVVKDEFPVWHIKTLEFITLTSKRLNKQTNKKNSQICQRSKVTGQTTTSKIGEPDRLIQRIIIYKKRNSQVET